MSLHVRPSPDGEPPSVDPEPSTDGTLSKDDVFDVLSNHRRRYALHHLKRRGGTVALGDLAEQIAAWENGVGTADLSAAERKRVYTALQQFHVPKMDEAGIVGFDDARGLVELTETASDLDVYLDVVADNDIPWSRYYLGLSGMSLVGVVGVWLAPFTLLPGATLAALVAGVVLVSALVHSYHDRRMRLGAADAPPDLPER